jgi:hypothetical protein
MLRGFLPVMAVNVSVTLVQAALQAYINMSACLMHTAYFKFPVVFSPLVPSLFKQPSK